MTGPEVVDFDQIPGLKAGIKTTEFWITAVCLVAGYVLISKGQESIGGMLMAVATGGYQMSRGLAKHGESAAAQVS